MMANGGQEIVIETNAPITIIRLAISEAIDTHSNGRKTRFGTLMVDNAWKRNCHGHHNIG